MRDLYQEISKALLTRLLEPFGTVEVDVEVRLEPQTIGLVFTPGRDEHGSNAEPGGLRDREGDRLESVNSDDRFQKELLATVLEPFGTVEIDREVRVDPQTIAVTFVRTQAEPSANPSQRFLSKIVSDWSLIETFSQAPRIDQVRSHVLKQYTWADYLEQSGITEEFPWLWMLSAAVPDDVIEGFRLRNASADVPGVYTSTIPASHLGLVVLQELPKTEETLLLRLLSKGNVLEEAMAELVELPEDLWVAQIGWDLLMRYPLSAEETEAEDLDPWGKDFVTRAAETVRKELQ